MADTDSSAMSESTINVERGMNSKLARMERMLALRDSCKVGSKERSAFNEIILELARELSILEGMEKKE